MFRFFRKKLADKAPAKTPLEVYVDQDCLYYMNRNEQEVVSLKQLDYAYVTVLGEDGYLLLGAEKQHYIAVGQTGFAEAYQLLSDRFGFDDILFNRLIKQTVEDKARIWIRHVPKNYTIQAVTNEDYKEGFEVLSTPTQFISWDTSYEELLAMGLTKLGETILSESYHTFLYPVRIGGLVLNAFGFNADNDRRHIAVLSYGLSLNNGLNTDGSYEELKGYFSQLIPTDLEEAGYEREDQKHLRFESAGLSFCICYDYGVESNYDNGHTFLYIENERDYEASILTARDDLHLAELEFLVFESELTFTPNYKFNPKVVAKPTLLTELVGSKQLCYWDKKTNRIGFAGPKSAIEFERKSVISVIIYNVLPAKGGGYAQLSVSHTALHPECIFYGELYSFDDYAKKIEAILGITVVMAPESYND